MLCGNNGALEPFIQNLGTCKPINQKTAGGLIAFNLRFRRDSIPCPQSALIR